MEKENVGKGKERVLCEKFCNRVSEEQNVEKENVRKERKFCNRVSKRFHKSLGWKGFGFGLYGGIKCLRSGLLWWRLLVF